MQITPPGPAAASPDSPRRDLVCERGGARLAQVWGRHRRAHGPPSSRSSAGPRALRRGREHEHLSQHRPPLPAGGQPSPVHSDSRGGPAASPGGAPHPGTHPGGCGDPGDQDGLLLGVIHPAIRSVTRCLTRSAVILGDGAEGPLLKAHGVPELWVRGKAGRRPGGWCAERDSGGGRLRGCLSRSGVAQGSGAWVVVSDRLCRNWGLGLSEPQFPHLQNGSGQACVGKRL